METPLILAIDQGTTNTKAVLIDGKGVITARASRMPSISYPMPAWVEQDPLEIWLTVQQVIDECIRGIAPSQIAALAITNQRETVLAWERHSGKPLGPAVVWQCHRSAEFCQALKERGLEPFLRDRTGLTIDPMFSGSKMRWLLDHISDGQRRAEAGEICLGNIDSWVLWNLSGGTSHTCDYTNASRTQLFNLHHLDWDTEILGVFGIPRVALPRALPSNSDFGQTMAGGPFPGGIPILSLIGDSHAALYGHAGFKPGSVKATYGTGTSLMTPTAEPVFSNKGLSTTIAWGISGKTTYALEGNIYFSGAIVDWLGRLLRLPDPAKEIEALASSIGDNEGVYLVPAFVGLGAPHWNSKARGLICGLTSASSAPQLARAALESIAYQVRDIFDLMQQEAGTPLETLLADGGASRNNTLMQFQADIIGKPLIRNLSTDVSALGAAYLAGLAAGVWSSEEEVEQLPRPIEKFEAKMGKVGREKLYRGWQEAVERTILK